MRIALLEDEPAQAELLMTWLTAAGHDCHHYDRGQAFLDHVGRETFDLLILDWNVPDMNGPDVLARVRERSDWNIPVLFITSRDREEDIVHALEAGADDYMAKPVKRMEVLARIGALERRALPQLVPGSVLEFPPYSVDTGNRVVSHDGKPVELTHKEYELALALFQHHGRLLSRSYLMEVVWGKSVDLNTRTVDTHVSRLRSKLGLGPAQGWRLGSIYQMGYRLERLDETD